MFTAKRGRLALVGAVAIGAMVALAGCSSSDPLKSGSDETASGDTIVIGSQQYYSNEIVAEAYAQALENAGFKVDRQFNIGQRNVYLPELEKGTIDVMADYSGSLLQYYDAKTTAKSEDDIVAALPDALPDGLRVLKAAEATDQDTYTVTKKFSEDNSITSLADLKDYSGKLVVGANAEFQTRPYGITGLKSVYGATATLKTISDSGGANTVAALKNGQVQLADIYSASPAIKANDFVSLEDPENMILPQHVIPVVDDKVDSKAAGIIEDVNAKLTQATLIDLNTTSVDDKSSAAVIAKKFLSDSGLVK
ncbi:MULTISPECIES: ABC transporter substrate-binding protein [unclassified Frondihabitans]|uniref:ABC transporter substrate-binding protein n=1 Tax=unclassified Frondihabitans TaxID=2626248 RepID=UPI000F510464|nr:MULTISPECIES: ABC transporter substrate-binding protein [unclassified Frondihabitans]RPE75309.1 osmoprotectant transport system substrate-binding protein [Frondihabitans sp. PhB153]RPF04551.1 osmoprotectant transport system substrate-binding protein [Frondihabitans sp. PhB161]